MRHDFSVDVAADPTCPATVVRVGGDFDAACTRRFDETTADAVDGSSAIVVDLTDTTIIDSGALGSLIRLRERCDERDVTFSTVVGRPFQVRLLRITGLGDFLGMEIRDGADDPVSDGA